MARSAKSDNIYKVIWTAKYGNSGEETFYSQREVDAWLRRMRPALLTYTVKKIFQW